MEDRPVSEDELVRLADELVTTSRALVAIAVRSIESAPVEVTVSQHRVLVLLTGRGPQSVGELAQHLGVNPSNATRLCDRLQKLGLVDRRPSPHDGRAVQVHTTEAGTALVETVGARRRDAIMEVLRRQSPAEVERTVAALASFNRAAHEGDDGT